MRTNIKLLFIALILIWTSCDKEKTLPTNEFTLDSATHKGFLFENLDIIDFPNSNDLKPDFIVLAQTSDNGDVLSPFLSQPDLENRFILSEEFDDFESAQAYFDSYSTPENKPFQQFALNVKPNQIWLIKTNSGKFGKILIISTEFNNIDNKPFAKATFKAENLN